MKIPMQKLLKYAKMNAKVTRICKNLYKLLKYAKINAKLPEVAKIYTSY
jgi:hypothetical protein